MNNILTIAISWSCCIDIEISTVITSYTHTQDMEAKETEARYKTLTGISKCGRTIIIQQLGQLGMESSTTNFIAPKQMLVLAISFLKVFFFFYYSNSFSVCPSDTNKRRRREPEACDTVAINSRPTPKKAQRYASTRLQP